MEVFFYGLFMDPNILITNGVAPTNPRSAYLPDYALRIGNRASLISCPGERSYGIVMTVSKPAIQKLYAEASVADYRPEEVKVVTDEGDTIEAICYNLPTELLTGTNESYGQALYKLSRKLGFPKSYLDKIEKMADGTGSKK